MQELRKIRILAMTTCLVNFLQVTAAFSQTKPAVPHEHSVPQAITAETVPAALTIGDLELIALANNPTLAQAAAQVDIARGKALQAGLYPNPTIGYDGEQMGTRGDRGAGFGERQGGFIQQEIVTGGKLRLSRAKYQQDAFAAEVQAQAQRLRVLNGIQIAYFEILAAQEIIAVQRTLVKNADEAVKTTKELVNVGQGNQMDLLQAEIEAQRSRVSLKNAGTHYRRNWEHLTTMIGEPNLKPRNLIGSLVPEGPALEWETSLAQLLQDSPEIQFAMAEVRRDEITVQRERKEPIPNVIVRGATGYNFETRATTADVSVGFRIPVFDRNQGTVKQAQADLMRAHAEVKRVELTLRNRLADAFSRYGTSLESSKDFREVTLPKAKQALELYIDSYQKRRAAWPQVLVAQRTYYQFGEEYINALVELRRAEVEIRGLLLVDGLKAPAGPTPGGHIDATPKPR